MKKDSLLENSVDFYEDDILQKALDILEVDDGRSVRKKIDSARDLFESALGQISFEAPSVCAADPGSAPQLPELFWQQGEPIPVCDGLYLRRVLAEAKESFLVIKRAYLGTGEWMENEAFCNSLWEEYIAGTALNLAIINNGCCIGYCRINDISKEQWEIAVELLPGYTGQGIGYAATSTMLDALRNRLGKTEYRIRIMPDNHPSQRLFEKLGAVPNGISEFILHGEEALERFEEKHLHRIDDTMVQTAEKFNVAPRKLLSHVLEYTLNWQ